MNDDDPTGRSIAYPIFVLIVIMVGYALIQLLRMLPP